MDNSTTRTVQETKRELDYRGVTDDDLAALAGVSDRAYVCHVRRGSRPATSGKAAAVRQAIDLILAHPASGAQWHADKARLLVEVYRQMRSAA